MRLIHLKNNTYCIEAEALSLLYRTGPGRCVLMDTPQGYEYGELRELLKAEGLVPKAVLLSHVHPDHCGCAAAIRRDYGARIAASLGEAAAAMSPTAMCAYVDFISPGSIAGTSLEKNVMDMDDVILTAQDRITADGAEFSVVHSRGHSPDHICLTTPDGVMFCGDALVSADQVARQKMTYSLGVGDQMASAGKLAEDPPELAVLSHRGLVRDAGEFKELCRLNIEHLETCVESILEVVQGRAMGIDEICAAYCLGLNMENVTTKNPTKAMMVRRVADAYIEYLVDTGRLDAEIIGGVFAYKRRPREASE